MDRLIHTARSGMRASMDSQRVIASNMANANTLGFRAEMLDQRAVTIEGQPNEARAMEDREELEGGSVGYIQGANMPLKTQQNATATSQAKVDKGGGGASDD